jgi:hypothetical protein
MPAFGIIRHVERRQTNLQKTGSDCQGVQHTRTLYGIEVTRFVFFWITVFTYEKPYGI